jgi:hypothetical protein
VRACRVSFRLSRSRSEDSELHFASRSREKGDLRARVVDLARKAWLYCGGKLNFASLLRTRSRLTGADVLDAHRRDFQ